MEARRVQSALESEGAVCIWRRDDDHHHLRGRRRHSRFKRASPVSHCSTRSMMPRGTRRGSAAAVAGAATGRTSPTERTHAGARAAASRLPMPPVLLLLVPSSMSEAATARARSRRVPKAERCSIPCVRRRRVTGRPLLKGQQGGVGDPWDVKQQELP